MPDPNVLRNHPHHNWIFAKIKTNTESSTGLDTTTTTDDSLQEPSSETPWDALKTAVENALPDFEDALKSFREFFLGVAKDPAHFNQFAVTDLIEHVLTDLLDALLKFADGVIRALLDLVKAAVVEMDSMLNKQGVLHIPLLSALFKDKTGQELTAARLVALMIELPTTIIYKLVHGVHNPRCQTTWSRSSPLLLRPPRHCAPRQGGGRGLRRIDQTVTLGCLGLDLGGPTVLVGGVGLRARRRCDF